uniref:Uncharacterized protein n=1 Tax=Nelumbo nucifera TaxID=4432 RepID=A0A822YUX8_NELNU|nr:TPA_asm: hypothetical protein HUJ06_006998 [Nelumbo nucifera]
MFVVIPCPKINNNGADEKTVVDIGSCVPLLYFETLFAINLVKPLDTGGCVFRNTDQSVFHLVILHRIRLQPIFDYSSPSSSMMRSGPPPLSTTPVLLKGSPLLLEYGGVVASDGSSGMVLGGEDVARAPTDLSIEGGEGFDQNHSLDHHVERASDLGSHEKLRRVERGRTPLTSSNKVADRSETEIYCLFFSLSHSLVRG